MKKIILMCLLAVATGFTSSQAQIYVSIRPARPVFARPVAPAPNYIWIEEDWDGVGADYRWHGGYWAAPPHPGYRYRAGYWRNTPRGYLWVRGSWYKPGPGYHPHYHHRGGHYGGHGNHGNHGHPRR